MVTLTLYLYISFFDRNFIELLTSLLLVSVLSVSTGAVCSPLCASPFYHWVGRSSSAAVSPVVCVCVSIDHVYPQLLGGVLLLFFFFAFAEEQAFELVVLSTISSENTNTHKKRTTDTLVFGRERIFFQTVLSWCVVVHLQINRRWIVSRSIVWFRFCVSVRNKKT